LIRAFREITLFRFARTVQIRSGPRSLASMLNNISPTNSVLLNPNAAVRQAFVVLVVRATRLTAAQADAYILSGGVVTVGMNSIVKSPCLYKDAMEMSVHFH